MVGEGQGPVDELLGEHDGDALVVRARSRPSKTGVDHERREPERHLVGDDELWRDGEGPGQGQHLLLAAREAAGPLGPACPEDREHLDRPVDGAGPRPRFSWATAIRRLSMTERPGKIPRPSGM